MGHWKIGIVFGAALLLAFILGPPHGVGEIAQFTIQGDTVRVNNTRCSVSRSPISPDMLGRYVSRVDYTGDDPRFRGKTFVFNLCCRGCMARFPAMWSRHADEILAYHGVNL